MAEFANEGEKLPENTKPKVGSGPMETNTKDNLVEVPNNPEKGLLKDEQLKQMSEETVKTGQDCTEKTKEASGTAGDEIRENEQGEGEQNAPQPPEPPQGETAKPIGEGALAQDKVEDKRDEVFEAQSLTASEPERSEGPGAYHPTKKVCEAGEPQNNGKQVLKEVLTEDNESGAETEVLEAANAGQDQNKSPGAKQSPPSETKRTGEAREEDSPRSFPPPRTMVFPQRISSNPESHQRSESGRQVSGSGAYGGNLWRRPNQSFYNPPWYQRAATLRYIPHQTYNLPFTGTLPQGMFPGPWGMGAFPRRHGFANYSVEPYRFNGVYYYPWQQSSNRPILPPRPKVPIPIVAPTNQDKGVSTNNETSSSLEREH